MQKILIVDDLEQNLLILKRILKDIDVEIVKAISGYEALDILNASPDFDLILSDVQMPGFTGFEMVQKINENEILKQIPVIFITAIFDKAEFIQQGFSLGAYDYILKPFEKEVLINKVKLYLSLEKEKKKNKKHEQELLVINRSLNVLNECNNAVIYSENKSELLQLFCNILTEQAGYPFAWIGSFDNKDNSEIEILAFSSKENIVIDKKNSIINCPLKAAYDYPDNFNYCCTVENCIIKSKFPDLDYSSICSFQFKFSKINNYLLVIHSNNRLLSSENAEIPTWNKEDNSNISRNEIDSEKELLNSFAKNLKMGLSTIYEKENRKKFQQALKKEKEELSITLSSITDGVISASAEGEILLFNSSACQILDIDELNMKEKTIYNLFRIIDKGSYQPFDPIDFLNEKDESIEPHISIITQKGNSKIITLAASLIPNTLETAASLVLVFHDITEKIKNQNMLALSQKMESVGQLAAGIAHEINTPMQFLGDNTEFLKDATESILKYYDQINERMNDLEQNGDYNDFIKLIKTSQIDLDIDFLTEEIKNAINSNLHGIERVTKIVAAMKNFAHPSSKNKVLSNINQGIDVTATISKNEWKYVSKLELNLDPNLPLIYCVIEEINQVILNMIINSAHSIADKIQSNDENLGLITIETNSIDQFINIIISDSGKGIPEANLNRIFDPFFTTKEVGKGTGQGLAIAHDIIVNKHKGEISVESQLGIGTKFIIKLPIE
ncbi:MAG: response regulator [Candidatus Kapabacteria bacterium]|nr:response regulator [Candidatus Kapabacteria bacterium]